MKTILTFSVVSLLCFRQCENEVDLKPMQAASVVFTGAYEVDGCGYQIQIEKDSAIHKPINLPEQYHQDGLAIWVEFKEDSVRYECGDLPSGRVTIRILKIKERNQ